MLETDHTAEEYLTTEAEAVARDCFQLQDPRLTRLSGGKVNDSFVVDSRGGRFVLQRLNSFFQGDEALGLNWRRVRQHLEAAWAPEEPPLPPIYPDASGRWLARHVESGDCWRLTGFVPGRPLPPAPAPAREAARLLGRLHTALNSPAPLELNPLPEGEFTNQRLSRAEDFLVMLEHYRRHPHLPQVEPLIHQAAEAAAQLPFCPGFINVFQMHDVVVHGDPKADNFFFAEDGRAAFLLDWDTVSYGHVLVDVAELLRSWGATADPERPLDEARATALLEGYGQTGLPLTGDDLALLPAVLRAVALNLARRYLTDSLAEVYFRWDPRKFPSLREQNLSRATAMLGLAEYLLDHEISLMELFMKK